MHSKEYIFAEQWVPAFAGMTLVGKTYLYSFNRCLVKSILNTPHPQHSCDLSHTGER
jgi:hypothetical protein